LLLAAGAAFAVGALGQQSPAASLPSPHLLGTCQACHGMAGQSASAQTPNLAGQKRGYLQAQLEAFRSGQRKHDLMSAIASQLTDVQIRELAAYWSAVPPAAPGAHGELAPVPSHMNFPAQFPAGFTYYMAVDDADNGTVARRYANAAAFSAARAGTPLPDGSVIVEVSHLALREPSTGQLQRDPAGRLVPGAVKSYVGMESRAGWGDAVPALLRNGNWHYAQFNLAKQVVAPQAHASCLACHKPLAQDSHVFSLSALKAAAH
jgi:cytochrome c553